ncbi:MAG: multicomponent Na+:H+ antiporter subunit B [Gammaproteobacteria bacterium]|jgi:multicomponent Na+:H+ antiporter subunit B
MIFLAIMAIGIARLDNLFAAVLLTGIFSLLSAAIFVVLDAVDVAFTEAAVGAGITTVLMLATLSRTVSRQRAAKRVPVAALCVSVASGLMLLIAFSDLPPMGSAQAPAQQHVAPRYIGVSPVEIGVPNMVTSVLASYRGYDTLGEVTVIFTAGIGVLALIGAVRQTSHASMTAESLAPLESAQNSPQSGQDPQA